jgi:hypothetical protein
MQAEFLSVAGESPKIRPLSLLGVVKKNMTTEIEEYTKCGISQLKSMMGRKYGNLEDQMGLVSAIYATALRQ